MPLPLLLGASAGVGALLNLLSRKKKKHYGISDLEASGYKRINPAEQIATLMRISEDRRKSIRSNANQTAAEHNLDPVATNYATEEPIDNALFQGSADIQRNADAENNRVAESLFNLNASQPDEQSPFAAILEGGITGAGIGSQIANTLSNPNDDYLKYLKKKNQENPNQVTSPIPAPTTPSNFNSGITPPPPIDTPTGITPTSEFGSINMQDNSLKPTDYMNPNTMDLFGNKKKTGNSLATLSGQPRSLNHLSYLNDRDLYRLKNLFG